MLGVRAKISRHIDDACPGWVECVLVDAFGQEHVFVEKIPAVLADPTVLAMGLPQPVVLGCLEIGRSTLKDGSELVRIDTNSPFGFESEAGISQFEVLSEQLCALTR
jgi:hypothetical protein